MGIEDTNIRRNIKSLIFISVFFRYTEMPDFHPTKRATKSYVTGWGNWLYDSPALRSRH